MYTIPSEKAYGDLLRYKMSFYIEVNPKKEIILYLKLFPDLFISILNKVPLQLVIRNSKLQKYSVTLYIYDVEEAPFYITKKFYDMKSEKFMDMIKMADVIEGDYSRIILSLFDENMQNKGSKEIYFEFPQETFSHWHKRIYNSNIKHNNFEEDFNGNFFPEDNEKGYLINIKYSPKDSTLKIYNGNKHIVSTNKFVEYFEFNNYISIGQQGYLQEQTIKEYFSSIFTLDFNLYSSLIKNNNEELTDFLIFYDYCFVLVESKCIKAFKEGEVKSVKNSEKAINKAVIKACKQLINAEFELINNPEQFFSQASSLIEQTIFAKNYIRLCVVNDTYLINKENLIHSLKQFNLYELPIIISLKDLHVLFDRDTVKNAIQTLLNIKDKIQNENIELPIFTFEK